MRRKRWVSIPTDDIEKVIPPGLDGTYRGTCLLCLRGTDTGIVTVADGREGHAEFHAGFLAGIGIPVDEAMTMVQMFPPDAAEVAHRICTDCAQAAGLPKPGLIASGELPGFRQSVIYPDD